MFENKRVRNVATMFARVAQGIPVEIKNNLALGGDACHVALDETVSVAERPLAGVWAANMTILDEDGMLHTPIVQTVISPAVQEDIVIIHILFSLAMAGQFQLEVINGEIHPTAQAKEYKSKSTEHDWKVFIHRWKMCVAQMYFMANNMLPCLPANSASNNTTAQELAEELWPQLIEDKPELFNAVLTGD